MARRRRLIVIAVVCVVILDAIALVALLPPGGPYTLTRFEPDRVADLELDMWKAYYAKQRLRLFVLLVTTLREQYGYSWARAIQAGGYLARGAARFGDARGDYDRVLPDLEAAFTIARDWTSSSFDPRAAARAELAWWVARRTPGQDDPAIVGQRIADAYAVLYQLPVERLADAGRLRADAAHLRDLDAAQPDWDRIQVLLRQSYRALKIATAR
jgi:hypothetical protein